MNYTCQRRKILNETFLRTIELKGVNADNIEKHPDTLYLTCKELPSYASPVADVEQLKSLVPHGAYAWHQVLVVVVKDKRITKAGEEYTYRINYVNCSDKSMQLAEDCIAKNRLYVTPFCLYVK